MKIEYNHEKETRGGCPAGVELMKTIFPGATRKKGMSVFTTGNDSIFVTWRRIIHVTRRKDSPLIAYIRKRAGHELEA